MGGQDSTYYKTPARGPLAGFTPQTFYVVAESDLLEVDFLCPNTF
jgi:hypothetical protein